MPANLLYFERTQEVEIDLTDDDDGVWNQFMIRSMMRSMPDNLERKFGLTPDVTQEIGKVVDECLDDIGKEFELFGAGGGPDV